MRFGELLAAVAFKAKKEGVEVNAFGAEIIQRLQEIYYSNESETILKKVKQAVESLAGEFISEVDINLVMAVAWKEFVYVANYGGGQAYLKRGEIMVGLLPEGEQAAVSGKLKPGDRLLLGTKQFCQKVTTENIKLALNKPDLQQVEEDLAGQVHSEAESWQAAVGIMEVEGGEEEAEPEPESEPERETAAEEVGEEKSLRRINFDWKNWGRNLIGKLPKIRLPFRAQEVFLREGGGSRSKKSAATVAIVLVAIFGISLVLAGTKRQRTKNETRYQAVLEEVRYKYDEAQGLTNLNPLRAKSLLKDSQDLIGEYKAETGKELTGELKNYEAKIGEALGGVQREYHLESATEWYDFGLVKEGFKGSDWEVEDKQVLVWDEKGQSLVSVNLETKAGQVVIENDDLGGAKLVGLAGDRGMAVSAGAITVIEVKTGKKIAEVGADEWQKIADAVGFGGNLYLLDQSKTGQIWKYLGVESGLGTKRAYLKGETYDLSEAVSLTIDGSVWVLFSDGTIVKYTQGTKEPFTVAGLDQPMEEPVKIFASPETENIYLLDKKSTRIVVISKTGEYRSQYIWPGIAGVKDLIASEEMKKIYLLTGEKIFTIEIKD